MCICFERIVESSREDGDADLPGRHMAKSGGEAKYLPEIGFEISHFVPTLDLSLPALLFHFEK